MNRTKINQKANRELKKLFVHQSMGNCEICGTGWGISFAHRHKRHWYYDKPDELLWNWNQVILACIPCHEKIEKDAELTEQVFLRLRGPETI